jgi:uncharacterized membrane protein
MPDWLRPLLLMFYSPSRGMAEARDRAQLGPSFLLALVAQSLLFAYIFWPYLFGAGATGVAGGFALFSALWSVMGALLFAAVVFVPVLIFVANMMERRGSFGVALQQEFAAVASTIFYARAAAALLALPLALLLRASGTEANVYAEAQQNFEQFAAGGGATPEQIQAALRPLLWQESLATSLMFPFLAGLLVVAVRAAFSFSWGRAAVAVLATGLIMLPLTLVLGRSSRSCWPRRCCSSSFSCWRAVISAK